MRSVQTDVIISLSCAFQKRGGTFHVGSVNAIIKIIERKTQKEPWQRTEGWKQGYATAGGENPESSPELSDV